MKKYRKSERGVALFFVVIALLLLTAIAAGIIFMSDTESGVNSNFRSEQQTYFASRAGLEEARVRIMPSTGVPPAGVADLTPNAAAATVPGTGAIVSATDVIYITNPNASDGAAGVQPWNAANKYVDDELCHENFQPPAYPANPGANIRCSAANVGLPPNGVYYNTHASTDPNTGTASAMNYKWVRITLKQNYSGAANTVDGVGIPANPIPVNAYTPICYDGLQEFLMNAADCPSSTAPDIVAFGGKPVYVITSLAVSPSGSRRMTQMEVANLPPIKTNAALDTQDFVNVGGSSVLVNGFDNCQCTCVNPKGGSGVPTCTFNPPAPPGTACTGSTYAIYTQQTVTTTGNPKIVSGTNPVNAQNQTTFPWNIPQLINSFANAAGTVIPSGVSCTGSPASCGTVSSGNFGTAPTPFPPVGAPIGEVPQITYFPGSVDLQAKGTGAGVMVVDGDLTIHGGFNFYGLIIVKGTLTFIGGGTGQGTNIVGGMLTGNGSVADSLSGGVNVQFDSCALKQNTITQPPLILASHEVSY